jgi:hypothetical protein
LMRCWLHIIAIRPPFYYTFCCSDCNVVLEKYVQLYDLGMGWGLHLKFGSESFNHAAWLVTWRLSPLLLQNQMS